MGFVIKLEETRKTNERLQLHARKKNWNGLKEQKLGQAFMPIDQFQIKTVLICGVVRRETKSKSIKDEDLWIQKLGNSLKPDFIPHENIPCFQTIFM